MNRDAQGKFVGAYAEPLFFETKGIARALDVYQEQARVQNLFLRGYVFHRQRENRETGSLGGAFFTPDPKYYRNTFLKDYQDERGSELLNKLLEEASARGAGVYFYFFPAKTPPFTVQGYERILERNVDGSTGTMACWRNPDYFNHLIGTVDDLAHNYRIRGIMWGAERCGPLGWTTVLGGTNARASCFCEHCIREARKAGLDSERARRGWQEIEALFAAVRAASPPPCGVFVQFWRLLTQYPEILAWEKLWWEGKTAVKQEIYKKVKAASSDLVVGHHLWSRGSFSVFSHAALDFDDLCAHADFVKPGTFSNPAAVRVKEQVDGLKQTIFADADPGDITRLLYAFLGYDAEAEYERLLSSTFSPRYLYRETEKVLKQVKGRIKVYAGVAAATYARYPSIREVTEQDVASDLHAAASLGVDGVIFGSVDMDSMAGGIGKALAKVGWV